MGLSDFPPELLTKIFLKLSYKSLLSVVAVCTQWNELVATDPALSVQTFKRLSTVYVAPGCSERLQGGPGGWDPDAAAEATEPVRIHPAIQKASYVMGNDVQNVYFYARTGSEHHLAELAIANDFVSIPVVTMVKILLPHRPLLAHGFKIKITNSKGVKVIDIFAGMAEESNREVLTAEYGLMTKAELLGDHVYYEGLTNFVRSGLGLSADLYCGS